MICTQIAGTADPGMEIKKEVSVLKIEVSKKDVKKLIACLKQEAELCSWSCLYDEEQEACKLMEKLQKAMENDK